MALVESSSRERLAFGSQLVAQRLERGERPGLSLAEHACGLQHHHRRRARGGTDRARGRASRPPPRRYRPRRRYSPPCRNPPRQLDLLLLGDQRLGHEAQHQRHRTRLGSGSPVATHACITSRLHDALGMDDLAGAAHAQFGARADRAARDRSAGPAPRARPAPPRSRSRAVSSPIVSMRIGRANSFAGALMPAFPRRSPRPGIAASAACSARSAPR